MAASPVRQVVEVTIHGAGISTRQVDRDEAIRLARELIPEIPHRSAVVTLAPLGTTTTMEPAKMPVSSRPNVDGIVHNVDQALSKGRTVQLFRHQY